MNTTTKRVKLWYICERHNPQLGVYYIREGQLSKTRAKAKERTIYGSNFMHGFSTVEEYEAKIKELESRGERIL